MSLTVDPLSWHPQTEHSLDEKASKEEVVAAIRDKNFVITQEIFNRILPTGTARTQACLAELSTREIYNLKNFFSENHWTEMPLEKLFNLLNFIASPPLKRWEFELMSHGPEPSGRH